MAIPELVTNRIRLVAPSAEHADHYVEFFTDPVASENYGGPARGAGLAAEASEAAIRHGYDQFGWSAIQTYMSDDNQAARALAMRLGGQDAGRHAFPDNLERTIYVLPRPDGTYPNKPDLGWDAEFLSKKCK